MSNINIVRIDGITPVTGLVTDPKWEQMECVPANSRDTAKSLCGNSADWFGTTSIASLKSELSGEWPKGFKRIDEKLSRLEAPRVQSVRRSQVWSDQGDTINMDKVYAGSLETAWRTSKRQSRNVPPSFRIVVSTGISADVSADVLFWKGAAAIKLADALTEAGYNLEIVAVNLATPMGTHLKGNKYPWAHEIKIKDFQAPFDRNTLGIAIAHPGFTRAGVFTVKYRDYSANYNVGWGLSAPGHVEGKTMTALGYDQPNVRNILISDEADFQNASTADAFIKRTVEGL